MTHVSLSDELIGAAAAWTRHRGEAELEALVAALPHVDGFRPHRRLVAECGCSLNLTAGEARLYGLAEYEAERRRLIADLEAGRVEIGVPGVAELEGRAWLLEKMRTQTPADLEATLAQMDAMGEATELVDAGLAAIASGRNEEVQRYARSPFWGLRLPWVLYTGGRRVAVRPEALTYAVGMTLRDMEPPTAIEVTGLNPEEAQARLDEHLDRTEASRKFWRQSMRNPVAVIKTELRRALRVESITAGGRLTLGTDDRDGLEVDHRAAARLEKGSWRRGQCARPVDDEGIERDAADLIPIDPVSEPAGLLLARMQVLAHDERERTYLELLAQRGADKAEAQRRAGLSRSAAIALEARIRNALK